MSSKIKYKSNNLFHINKISSFLEGLDDDEYDIKEIHNFILINIPMERKTCIDKINEIGKIYNLEKVAVEIIQLLFISKINYELNGALHSCYESLENAMSKILDYDLGKIIKCYNILNDYDLVDYNEIDDNILTYLKSKSSSLLDYTCTAGQSGYLIESFHIDKEVVQTAVNLIKGLDNARILIHGASGTGKTQFAASLAVHCGKTPYFVNEQHNTFIAIRASGKNDLVIADEIDDMLNQMFFRNRIIKGEVNNDLDKINKQSVFIANDISYVDKSILRRFHFIIEFEELENSERLNYWKANLQGLATFLTSREISAISTKYKMPIGIVAKSAEAAVAIGGTKRQMKTEFINMLESHNKFYDSPGGISEPNKKFGIEYLNLSIPVQDILSHALKYKSGKHLNKKRFSLLFHGKPGTGKSEFARYLAEKMKLDAHVVMISDILDKYVGENEKNVRDAFAAGEGRVLIFDEADSMLFSRSSSARSWENSLVNEFLAQMDRYKGILVCTTNHLTGLDNAALRRFDWKVEFKEPSGDQLYEMVRRYFSKIDFSAYIPEINSLKGLTGGDVAVVAGRFWDDLVTPEQIINALKNELSYKSDKSKTVGFSKI